MPKMALRIDIRQGKRGRYRWFAMNDKRIVYSSFPRSFSDRQSAWKDAEWAVGVSVTMVNEDPEEGFEQYSGPREFAN